MDDKELYKQILGINFPWEITDLNLNLQDEQLDIYVKYISNIHICPHCKNKCTIHDYTKERLWRHLDSCQLKTIIHASQPRIKCKSCGVKTITPPWSEENSRFTKIFEKFAISVIQATKCDSRASNILRVNHKVISHLKQKAVKRGLSRRSLKPITALGIDEKSIESGHNYSSIIYNINESYIIDMCKGRSQEPVETLMENIFSEDQRAFVKYFTVDMWQAFINAIKNKFPNCKVIHDKFHIVKYLNDAVDKTRRYEHKKLLKEDDNSLSKSKYLYLKNEENMTEKQKENFSLIRDADLETSKVWALKETFKKFFGIKTLKEADLFFDNWCKEVAELNNKYLIKVCDMIKSHYKDIRTYIKQNLTNAVAESLNAKIQEIKTIARGYRGFKNFRINVLFHLGKLDLYPHTLG